MITAVNAVLDTPINKEQDIYRVVSGPMTLSRALAEETAEETAANQGVGKGGGGTGSSFAPHAPGSGPSAFGSSGIAGVEWSAIAIGAGALGLLYLMKKGRK